MIVDDDRIVLRACERLLRGLGEIVVCSGGLKALDEIRRGGVALLVSDVNMPEMTGIELLRTVRESDRSLPVILVTGVPNREDETAARDLDVFGYLTKPFVRDELRSIVRRALGQNAAPSDRPGR
ncbi:MAG TPA: response regulator [Polyangiaceae bacterium]|nr:response regulator [Polyangiaceae bacterium]